MPPSRIKLDSIRYKQIILSINYRGCALKRFRPVSLDLEGPCASITP